MSDDTNWLGKFMGSEIDKLRAEIERLRAAVKAQEISTVGPEEFSEMQRRAYQLGRAEAFEEAAKALEKWPTLDIWRSEAAAAIRARKD